MNFSARIENYPIHEDPVQITSSGFGPIRIKGNKEPCHGPNALRARVMTDGTENMSRHLTLSNIQSAMTRSKSVEQFLGTRRPGEISWIEIRPATERFETWFFEVQDVGGADFMDLYSFPPIGEDWPDAPSSTHNTLEEAMEYCHREYAALPDKWVNQFVIQDEYLDSKTK